MEERRREGGREGSEREKKIKEGGREGRKEGGRGNQDGESVHTCRRRRGGEIWNISVLILCRVQTGNIFQKSASCPFCLPGKHGKWEDLSIVDS